jgi:hypothetical protein
MGVRRRIRLSVKRPMNGHLRKSGNPALKTPKPDSMIIGREAGPGRHAGTVNLSGQVSRIQPTGKVH